MPKKVLCGAASQCRRATTVRQLQTRGEWWEAAGCVEHTERVCGAHRACAAAAACETRGNPDRGMSSSAFHTSVEHTERVCGAHRACAAAAACETRGNPDRGMSSSAFPHDPAEASTTPGPHDPAASSLFEAGVEP